MKGGKLPLGYTIVEVMIVLGVSSLMFIMAATFINGKQQGTSFQQGVNELASRLQGTIEDVADGHYSDVPLKCTQNTATGLLQFPAVVAEQGTNSPCVFLGKILHFSIGGDPVQYETFSLAGARLTTSDTIVTNLLDAHVTPVPGLTTPQTTPQTLDVNGMDVTDAAGSIKPRTYAIGFIQGLGKGDNGSTDTFASGTQSIGMVYAAVDDSKSSPDAEGLISMINSNNYYAKKVVICLTDGTRYAHLTLGGDDSANKLAVATKIDDAKVCS